MNRNLAILNGNRRSNGYLHMSMHDNPNSPRRSEMAPISVKNSSRIAAFYALFLAGQYAAQAAKVLNRSPEKINDTINRRSNTSENSNDKAAGKFDFEVQEHFSQRIKKAILMKITHLAFNRCFLRHPSNCRKTSIEILDLYRISPTRSLR